MYYYRIPRTLPVKKKQIGTPSKPKVKPFKFPSYLYDKKSHNLKIVKKRWKEALRKK